MKKLVLFVFLVGFSPIFGQTTTSNSTPSELEEKRLAEWRNIMEYGVSSQRLNIVKKIRHDKLSNNLPIIQDNFTNENNRAVKEEMLFTFMDLKMTDSGFWNTLFANEKDIVVLQRAAYAVETLEIPVAGAVYNALIQHTNSADAMRFNGSAVRALGQLKHMESIPVITEFATNRTNNNDLRGAAVVALGMYENPQLIPTLQNFLTNTIEPRLIRRYAAMAIGRTKDPSAIEILKPIILAEDEEQSLRLNAIEGIGYLPTPETIEIVELMTKSDNTAMRTEAVKSLGRMKSTGSQKLLEFKAFEDPEAVVRREAKNALQAMGLDVEEVEKMRKDPNYVPKPKTESTNQ
ncbi:MAG: HEAT repeat domain-containing protein [Brevinema sp.]